MMRGGGWGPPRTYASMTDPGGGGRGDRGGGGSGRGGQGGSHGPGRHQQSEPVGGNERQEQILGANRRAQEANREAMELKQLALKKKAYLQLKWDLDSHRKHLGRGNIVNILINEQGQRVVNVQKVNINKMLRVSGFTAEDVMGITINEYRSNQVEVMFKDEVHVDTDDMENKINNNGFDVSVSKFEKTEDFVSIYGLPLTNNIGYVENQIREAIGPFVKEVTEVKPMVHMDEDGDDFFKGKRNGNWRVKAIPKMGKQIPNYIVVGNEEKVMGKVVYSKNAGEKLEMCSDCFSTEHFKRSPDCLGPVKWSVYCEKFKNEWSKNFVEQEVQDDQVSMGVRESRVAQLQKNLEKLVADVANKEKELEEKRLYNEGIQQELEQLKVKVVETNDSNVILKEDLKKLEIKVRKYGELEEQVKILAKKNEELESKSKDDQVLMETAFRRMSANVTFRARSRSLGSVGRSEQLDISSWKIPPGPHLLPTEVDPPQQVSLVATQEFSTSEVMEEDEVFGSSISPPWYGFTGDENEQEVRSKLGEKIDDLEANFKISEENTEEVGLETIQDTQNLNVQWTPKRSRTGEPKPQRIVKRRSDPKDVVKHPEVGKEINLETYGGIRKYTVHSKKNRRKEDYSYTLTNEEGEKVLFDLKDQSWEYSQEEGDPLSPRKIEMIN